MGVAEVGPPSSPDPKRANVKNEPQTWFDTAHYGTEQCQLEYRSGCRSAHTDERCFARSANFSRKPPFFLRELSYM